jgi:hypothetical protein
MRNPHKLCRQYDFSSFPSKYWTVLLQALDKKIIRFIGDMIYIIPSETIAWMYGPNKVIMTCTDTDLKDYLEDIMR